MLERKYIDIDVHEAAKQRISYIFDEFEEICVSFSGGKDSTVMTHLIMDEAISRGRKVALFFIDWECQFTMTRDHVRAIYDKYKDNIIPYWIQIPMMTNNSCSMFEPLWKSWDEDKKSLWVRDKEKDSITDKNYFPFYYEDITFEEFVPLFGKWYSKGKDLATFVGIRTGESLNRFRTIVRDKPTYKGHQFTTNVVDNVWNVYPIYDWTTKDDWIYFNTFNKEYNKLYDRMHQAGLSIDQMRIDEPFGNEARKNLWIYHIIEPAMWSKFISRMNGVNTGALYSKERGSILGNAKISLPDNHTWESFANSILDSMPPNLSEHYKNKIARYVFWYRDKGYEDGIPDFADIKLENYGKVPSWRLVCKTLLRNDYWCKGLGFSINKSSNYKKYMDLMRRNRDEWGIYPDKSYVVEDGIRQYVMEFLH